MGSRFVYAYTISFCPEVAYIARVSCLQFWFYMAAASAELAGVLLAGIDVFRSHNTLKKFVDENDPTQHASGYGPHPLVKMALAELLGGRLRRASSIVLLASGVLLGLAGNLAG